MKPPAGTPPAVKPRKSQRGLCLVRSSPPSTSEKCLLMTVAAALLVLVFVRSVDVRRWSRRGAAGSGAVHARGTGNVVRMEEGASCASHRYITTTRGGLPPGTVAWRATLPWNTNASHDLLMCSMSKVNTYTTRKMFRKLSGATDYTSDSPRLLYTRFVFWGSIIPYAVPPTCAAQRRFVGSYDYSVVVMRNPWRRLASAYWDKMDVRSGLRDTPCNEFLENCCGLRKGLFGVRTGCGVGAPVPSFAAFLDAIEWQMRERGRTNDHWETQTRLCNLGTIPYKRVFDLEADQERLLTYMGATRADVAAVQSSFSSSHKRSTKAIGDAFTALYEVENGVFTSALVERVGRMYAEDIAFAKLHGIHYTFENAIR